MSYFEVKEQIDDPSWRADVTLVLERVAFNNGEDAGDWEDDLGHAQAAAEGADFFDYCFVGLSLAFGDGLFVG